MGIKEELSKRIAMKREKKQTTDRNKVEKQLKSSALEIAHNFPLMEEQAQADLADILSGKVVGCQICRDRLAQSRTQTENNVQYNGKLRNGKRKQVEHNVVGYWSQDETYDDAVHYDVSIFEMAADFICDDLTMA